MARPKANPEQISKALSGEEPERFKLSAIGTSGLNVFNGVTYNELHQELQWPRSATTFKKMSYSTPIAASLSLYENLVSKVTWRVVPPLKATEEEKKQAKFIEECLHDMDVPFRQVIKDALSANTYGFAIQEKVFFRRNKNSGSMFNDNKIGLKKLALRNQETIEKFIFDETGDNIVGVKQNLSGVVGNRYINNKELEIVIPRSKYMHITMGRNRGDPFGKSPLRDAFIAWKYLEVLSELEATGVMRDLAGVPILKVPAQYMSADASDEQKAILENLKNIVRNLQANTQSGVILPSAMDEATRTPLFDLGLLSTEGGRKSFDLNVIKAYYQNQIYTAMSADILTMGQSTTGSYSLASVKNTLTGSYAEAMLDTIVDAFNRDVIRHLYQLNGFDVTRCASLDYENLHNPDLDIISRFGQRLAATSMLPRTHDVVNYFLTAAGLEPIDESIELDSVLGEMTSRSGDSLNTASGGLNGTADSVASTDTSSSNLENG